MSKAVEFLESLQSDELSAEEGAKLLDLALGESDASVTPDTQDEASNEPEGEPEAKAEDAPKDGELTPENAVILAKDGRHTIPYDKLVEARNGEREWRERALTATQELESLKAQAAERAAAGASPTDTDEKVAVAEAAIAAGVDASLFGDFSEEALSAGIQKLVQERVQAALQQFETKLAPLQSAQMLTDSEKHYAAIYSAHPDADSIAQSAELDAWIAKQPGFAQAAYQRVLADGTTKEIIDLFDAYKLSASESTQQQTATATAAARQVVAKAQLAPPETLTDIPGGVGGKASRFDALADMNPEDQLDAVSAMTPEQIAAYMDRAL